MAAAVAAATCGLLGAVHIPKGITLTIGVISMIVAAGIELAFTRFAGKTLSWLGVMPKLHISIAPWQTS